jgi:predicted nuclease of restriction endonuclease-like (RecB) superfamily
MTNVINNKKSLFERVVSILEQARANIVSSVNNNIIVAYWMIGREIVEELQAGKKRAVYGKQIIEDLSTLLTKKYGKGFSITNLKNFRTFYQVYFDRINVNDNSREAQDNMVQKGHPMGDQSDSQLTIENTDNQLTIVETTKTNAIYTNGFNSHLTWSHYRALMRVKNDQARLFYELEAAECSWSKTQLERQIQTNYYERIIKNNGKAGLLPVNRERLTGYSLDKIHLLKAPYILEFLDLPDSPKLHENKLEQAIIDNLQLFLLELGKGFAFVARQKHIRVDDDEFYVDLVFYNFILKCFLLIDLKIGHLTHRDVGQMDGYVRMFEDQFKVSGDNPTVGLILCSDKSESVAKYSVLKDSKQLFAAKYVEFLPSEEDLKFIIEKERKMIENILSIED